MQAVEGAGMEKTPYDAAFYARDAGWRGDYVRMASWLASHLDFQSVCDFGCGGGLMLSEMLKIGKKVRGVDGSPYALEAADPAVRPFLSQVNLERLLCMPADLVMCTEVVEHLGAAFADTLVQSLTDSARHWIYLTAATPGQGGTDHVNEQPHSYWIEKLEARGFGFRKDLTDRFREHLVGIKPWWFQKNALIFRRGA